MLGVDRDAGEAEIKKAFRELARELHPDVNNHDPEAEEKFKAAAEAYEVLSDPERRRTYDAFGHEGLRSGGWILARQGRQRRGHPLGVVRRRRAGCSATCSVGGAGPGRPGGDVAAEVEITLAEVLTGVEARGRASRRSRVCEHCRGNGAEPGTPIRTCETCGGAGPGAAR